MTTPGKFDNAVSFEEYIPKSGGESYATGVSAPNDQEPKTQVLVKKVTRCF